MARDEETEKYSPRKEDSTAQMHTVHCHTSRMGWRRFLISIFYQIRHPSYFTILQKAILKIAYADLQKDKMQYLIEYTSTMSSSDLLLNRLPNLVIGRALIQPEKGLFVGVSKENRWCIQSRMVGFAIWGCLIKI